jgi:glycosyltransferase involved in cell wall biosynthesis
MRILQCLDTLNPRAGGTVEACRVLTLGMLRQNQDVEVVTLSPPDNPWSARWPCPVHCLGPSYTRYLYSPRLIPWLIANCANYDALVVHNIYRYIGYGVWRATRTTGSRYYLFTHGMLAPWFRTQSLKYAKKTIFWKLAGHRMFRDAATVLYTAEDEMAYARYSFSPYQCQEHVVGLGIADPVGAIEPDVTAFRPVAPYLLFLGRITPKKRVDLLIRAFASVYRNDPMRLVIAGPDEDGLTAQYSRLPESRALGGRLIWTGHLDVQQKWSALAGADAIALVSHTENFGIALVEALAMGVPVLTTRKVDIWREISAAHAGFAFDDDLSGATQLLANWRILTAAEKQTMRRNARELFLRSFDIDRVTRRLLAVLAESKGQPPPYAAPPHPPSRESPVLVSAPTQSESPLSSIPHSH